MAGGGQVQNACFACRGLSVAILGWCKKFHHFNSSFAPFLHHMELWCFHPVVIPFFFLSLRPVHHRGYAQAAVQCTGCGVGGGVGH